ncbi:MAG: hypothetical protein RR150_10305 [Clostridia bacterium]
MTTAKRTNVCFAERDMWRKSGSRAQHVVIRQGARVSQGKKLHEGNSVGFKHAPGMAEKTRESPLNGAKRQVSTVNHAARVPEESDKKTPGAKITGNKRDM